MRLTFKLTAHWIRTNKQKRTFGHGSSMLTVFLFFFIANASEIKRSRNSSSTTTKLVLASKLEIVLLGSNDSKTSHYSLIFFLTFRFHMENRDTLK